jgi:hypothetical protein
VPTAPGADGVPGVVGAPTAPGSDDAPGPASAATPDVPAAADAAVREPATDDSGDEESAGAVVPRATPAQRPAAPRPAPMPLRQSQPSAAARRPAQPAARRPVEPAREGRSAGTIALLVGLGVLILGGGAFALSQVGGDDTPAKPNQPAQPATETAAPTTIQGSGNQGTSTTPAADTNVAVLNGTTFNGLAGKLQDRVAQQGFQRGKIATNPDQSVTASTVYYASGFRSQALRIARQLNVRRVKPLDAATKAAAPQADIVVLAGADQTP